MKKTNKDYINKKELKNIKEHTAEVQPEKVIEKDTDGCSERDIEIYKYISDEVYKKLCDKDLSFYITWVSPETRKTFAFYRFYHMDNNLKNRAKYFDSMLRIGKQLLSFIIYIKLDSLLSYFNYQNPNEVESKEIEPVVGAVVKTKD